MAHATDNLRLYLRQETRTAHDRLDAAMRAASGWTHADGYARFLAMQFEARAGIEDWCMQRAPRGLCPPPQTPLIAADLAALGQAVPSSPPSFHVGSASLSFALGIGWALSGSSLGNRAILKEVRRAAPPDAPWPASFLSDEAMPAFWTGLRGQIERPADAQEAREAAGGAAAAFDHFLQVAQRHDVRPAAVAAPTSLPSSPFETAAR